MIRIFDLKACPSVPMEQGRGETVRLVNANIGTEKLDLHVNRLIPGGARGRMHRHSHADNVYIVRRGEGVLTADGRSYALRADQVVFIPAGVVHSLSNLSNDVFEIIEIWAPAGRQFDSIPVDPPDGEEARAP